MAITDELREFAQSIAGQNEDFATLLVSEYAKRLRLAGDAE